jgi:hypothetical protein
MSSTNPGPAVTTGNESQVSIGNIQKSVVLTTSLTPASVASATTAAQSFTVSPSLGLVIGDQVSAINPPSYTPAGVYPVGGIVTAADTISITWANVTAGALTPPAGTYTIEINRIAAGIVPGTAYLNNI